MSWGIHDQFIDLSKQRHTVVFRNRDTGMEHHVLYTLGIHSCPSCGSVRGPHELVDFNKLIAEELVNLNAHHRMVAQHREKHPHVRFGTEPKK